MLDSEVEIPNPSILMGVITLVLGTTYGILYSSCCCKALAYPSPSRFIPKETRVILRTFDGKNIYVVHTALLSTPHSAAECVSLKFMLESNSHWRMLLSEPVGRIGL